jgi:hypothetical protein
MKIFPKGTTEDAVKAHVRDWVGLLAEGRLSEAVDFISPEIPEGSGATSTARWTSDLLEAVIGNYGLEEPFDGDDWRYRVAPLSVDLVESFNRSLDVNFEMWERTGPDGARLAGAIHVDLPLIYEDGPSMSDLTARFMFKHLADGGTALVLLDVHVL